MMIKQTGKHTNDKKGAHQMTAAGLVIVMLMGGAQLALAHGDEHHHMDGDMHTRMGDWYMASYDLDHPGKHQVMVLFKTEGGEKHFVGVEYASGS